MAQQIIDEFQNLWNSKYARNYSEFIDIYAERYKIIKRQREIARKEEIPSFEKYCLRPNTMQVGFIRNLPAELMEAFQATLEELDSADLLIHVADASHTDLFLQISSVETILDTLDLGKVPRLLVLNKWDLLDPAVQAELGDALPDALHVSALKGTGLETLMKAIESRLLGLKT